VTKIKFAAVDPKNSLSSHFRIELGRIHNEAFPPEERHFTADFFIDKNGHEGYSLWLASLNGVIVGYSFFQIINEHNIALFWYMAVDIKWRNHGIGREMIQRLLKELKSNPASVRYLFLESHTPEDDVTSDDFNRRRLAFYRSQGAYWIRGIVYAVPSNTDPLESIRYEFLFFPIMEHVDNDHVKQALRVIAEGIFKVGDPRAEKFEKSLEDMYIQPPPKDQ